MTNEASGSIIETEKQTDQRSIGKYRGGPARKGGKAILFGKKKQSARPQLSRFENGLPTAVAFVDYESWYVSLIKNYGIKPDIKGWFEDLAKRVNITEAIFFADFSHKSLAYEIKRIRPYSNKIIDTRNPLGVQKDFTDFIILDNIYQKALLSDDVDCFVLFSGDGHFSSVTSFLKNIYGKQVGVYAINGSFSHQLRETSSWSVILPTEESVLGNDYRLLLDELKQSKVMYTESKLLASVCNAHRNAKKENLKRALDKLIAEKVITVRKVSDKKEGTLFVDWDAAAKYTEQ